MIKLRRAIMPICRQRRYSTGQTFPGSALQSGGLRYKKWTHGE